MSVLQLEVCVCMSGVLHFEYESGNFRKGPRKVTLKFMQEMREKVAAEERWRTRVRREIDAASLLQAETHASAAYTLTKIEKGVEAYDFSAEKPRPCLEGTLV